MVFRAFYTYVLFKNPFGQIFGQFCGRLFPDPIELPPQADPFYLAQLGGGLKPDKDKHESFLWLDRDSGLPMSVAARVQDRVQWSELDSVCDDVWV